MDTDSAFALTQQFEQASPRSPDEEQTAKASVVATPSIVLILRSEPAHDRHGRVYLRLTVRTTDGRDMEARWWRYPYPPDRLPQVAHICHVSAALHQFDGRPH